MDTEAFLIKEKGEAMKKLKTLKTILACICIMFICVFGTKTLRVNAAANKEMNIYAMYLENEDKGDSVLLESKGEYLLMDLGVASHAPAIIEQLNALGVKDIDIYISHLHLDHVGGTNGDFLAGLKSLANAGINIHTMYLPDKKLAPLSVDYADKYQKIEGFMQDKGKIIYLKVGDIVTVGDATGKIIGPLNVNKLDPDDYAGLISDGDSDGEVDPKYTYYENNCSLAAIFTCGTTRFFTAGDCLEDEAKLLVSAYGSSLQCDIMKLSHHGTGSGNTEELLGAVRPRYSFASNTGLAGVNSDTKKWKTHVAVKNASQYGICYQTGSQKKTMIYQIKNDVIKMYQGKTIKAGKHLVGWQRWNGADGEYRKSDCYYLDRNGVPLTGVQYLDGHYYYFGEGGCMEYGNYDADGKYQYWKSYGDKRRYYTFSDDKKYSYMTVGFREISGVLYYFDAEGIKLEGNGKTEKVKIGNQYYSVGMSGAIARSTWSTIGKNKYYFGKNGTMQANYKAKIGKNYYIFGSDGKMLRAARGKNLVTLSGKKYCVGTSGAVTVNDWATVGSAKYYCGKDGTVQRNTTVKIGKTFYYFGSDGKMVRASKGKKLVTIGKKVYCVGTSGALTINDWATVGKDKYYFGKNGTMCKDKRVKINKSYYYFGEDGKMVRNAKVKIGKKSYYFGKSGVMYTNKYVKIKGKTYYCNKAGIMKKK